jgi:VWFA-related protein
MRRRWSGLTWLVCLLAGLAAEPALRAQTREPPRVPVLPPVTTEVVRLDVVVSQRGQARGGLTREDFTVLEDGQPQTIVQFEAYAGTARTTALVAEPTAPPSPAPRERILATPAPAPARYVVLFVDDVHIDMGGVTRLKKSLARFVEDDLGPEDRVALVTTSGTGGSGAFLTNRGALQQAVSQLSLKDRRSEWFGAPYLSEYQAELIERGDEEALDVAAQELVYAGVVMDRAAAEGIAKQKARSVLHEAVAGCRLTLTTLEGLVRGLSGLPGRKVVFLLSDGFLTGISAHSGIGYDLQLITDAGTRAGVVIYSLDTGGLVASFSGGSASNRRPLGGNPYLMGLLASWQTRGANAEKDAMNGLAAGTGGFLVENSNDLRAGLQRMLKDTETYYVLAYEPSNTQRDGAFRRIEVRLPGHRDLKVRARAGYYAPGSRTALRQSGVPQPDAPRGAEGATKPPQIDAALRAVLAAPPPESAIPVRLSADFVKAEDGAPQAVVSGYVDANALPAPQGEGRPMTVEVGAQVFDESGTLAASLETEQKTLGPTSSSPDLAPRDGLGYQKGAALGPGRYEVRLAVREPVTGRVGSASQWLEIPDLATGRLTLSSLFLLKADGATPGPAETSPEGDPRLHSVQAVRRFRRDESLYLHFYVYNPRRDATGATSLVSQMEVLRDGAVLGLATPEAMAQADLRFPLVSHTSRIKLQPLGPGSYELRVTVTDHNALEKATRSIGFAVE